MKQWDVYRMVSGIVFTMVCLAHLLRNLSGWPFVFGPYNLPPVLSWIAFAGAGALAIWSLSGAKR